MQGLMLIALFESTRETIDYTRIQQIIICQEYHHNYAP